MKAIFKKIRNIIIYSFLGTCIILVCLYFLITSNFFLTKILTPFVGHLMGAEFVIEHAEYDPFSSLIQFKNARLGDKENPFAVAEYGTGHIDVLSLFDNTLKLSNVYIRNVDLNFRKGVHGRWSIPWLYDKSNEEGDEEPGLQLDFYNVNVFKLNIYYHDGFDNDILLKDLTLKSKYFKNGVMSLVEYHGDVESKLGIYAQAESGKISNKISVSLDENCIPSDLDMSMILSIADGQVGKTKILNRDLVIDTEIKRQVDKIHSYDIKFFNIKDSVDTGRESYIDTDGILRFDPFKLFLNIRGGPVRSPVIDIVYNLFGDFRPGDSKLLFLGSIDLSSSRLISEGRMLLSSFKFAVENFKLTDGLPLNLYQDYRVNLDFNSNTITVDKSDLSLSIDDKNIVSSHLNIPFSFNYKKGCLLHSLKNPDISIKTRGLNLKLLNLLMTDKIRFFSGTLDSDLNLLIDCEKNDINLKGSTNVKDLSLHIAGFDPLKLTSNQSLNFIIENDLNLKLSGSEELTLSGFKISFLRQEEGFKSDFNLLSPLVFNVDDKGISLNSDIKFDVSMDDYNVSKINTFLSYGFPVKFLNGIMRYKYLLVVPKTMDSVNIKGRGDILYCNMDLFGIRFNNLSLSCKLGNVYCDSNKIKYDDCIGELYVHGARGLKVSTAGETSFQSSDNLDFEIIVDDLNQYFFDILSPGISDKLEKLKLDGKVSYNFMTDDNLSVIRGDLNIKDSGFNSDSEYRIPEYSGDLHFNFKKNRDEFSVNSIDLNLEKNQAKILNLKINGGFPLPLQSGKSSLNILSDSMAFDEVADIFYELASTEKGSGEKNDKPKEFEPLNLYGLDLDGDIQFKNIFCGNLIKSKYYGLLKIQDNRINLVNRNFNINDTRFEFDSSIDIGASDGYVYQLSSSFKNLNMNPLIKTFVSGQYRKTKGTIDYFSINLNGKGFTQENLAKYLKGKLKINLSDLSLPYQIGEYDLLYILLIPFEILVKLREMLPGGLVVKNLEQGINSTKNIFVNKDNINLEKGQIYMTAENGIIDLDKIHFAGGKNHSVKYSDFSGTVGVNGDLDISANSNISSIRLPINISGTVSKPEINYTLFVPEFLAVNIANILNPMNIVDLLVDAGKGVSNTVISTGKIIAEPFESQDKDNKK